MRTKAKQEVTRIENCLKQDKGNWLEIESCMKKELTVFLNNFFDIKHSNVRVELIDSDQGVFLRLIAKCDGVKKMRFVSE